MSFDHTKRDSVWRAYLRTSINIMRIAACRFCRENLEIQTVMAACQDLIFGRTIRGKTPPAREITGRQNSGFVIRPIDFRSHSQGERRRKRKCEPASLGTSGLTLSENHFGQRGDSDNEDPTTDERLVFPHDSPLAFKYMLSV